MQFSLYNAIAAAPTAAAPITPASPATPGTPPVGAARAAAAALEDVGAAELILALTPTTCWADVASANTALVRTLSTDDCSTVFVER